MKEELLESRYIHCDESRIQVLGEPDQKGTTQNWMRVYLTDEFSVSRRWYSSIMKGPVRDIIL